jgi:competence protein ComEC
VPPLAARYNSKKAAAAFAMLISFMYLLISGAQIPTQRAFMMTFVVFLGILFDRRAVSMRMLAFAAFVVLLISPQALVGAGFQMSFAAVTVLIAFYERYASAIQRYLGGHSLIKIITAYIVGLLISDFVASTATLPFAIYHFNKIAVYTTLGNLLAGPIIGCVIMPFVLMALLLMPFGADFIPLKIVGWGVRWVNGVTEWVSSLPNAGFKVLSMPLWGLILIVFGGLWICLWQKRWRRLGLVPLLIGVCSLFFRSVPDALYSADAQDFACRDQDGRMVIVSEKTDSWTRRIWLEKTLGEMPNDTEKEHKSEDLSKEKQADQINLSCFQEECVCRHLIGWKKGTLRIGKEIRNTKSDGGGAVYLHNGKVKIKTVCAEVGSRPWNLCP